MRMLSFAVAVTVSTFASASKAAAPDETPQVHNKAMAFVEFWDANKDKSTAEQVAAFKARVAPVFPGFYSVERFNGELTQAQYDGWIESAIKGFPALRDDYIKKARQFESELPKYVATFKTWFPDYKQREDIYVLHSLGEMDGGPRTIGGKSYLVFGVDAMVKYHGAGNESPFFHHELFHTYHAPVLESCEPPLIWSVLWREGLATYVSKVMNPGANEKELLLSINDMAQRTRAVLPEALAQLDGLLDKDDYKTYAGLFTSRGDAGKLPPRRGYYLGYLVAQEAAKTHDIRELARLGCGEAKQLVFSTVHRLRANTH